MITAEELIERSWRFSRSTGEVIAADLRFEQDGSFSGDMIGETGWAIENGALVLSLGDGTVTNRFDRRHLVSGNLTRLCGKFVMAPGQSIYHFLDPSAAQAPMRESRFNVSMSLSGESDTVLVIFNSAGRPSEGPYTRWEFFDLPIALGLDHVRIAEVRSPTVYYTDKLLRLQSMLHAIIAGTYRRVVLIGMSSGAYASLLLAERLCRILPDTSFRTFVINPQTAHSQRHRDFITQHVPYGLAAELLTDQAVGMAGRAEIDLEIAVLGDSCHRHNVRHTMFYDSENMAEAYYVSLVAGLPGFETRPVPLGLSHVEGTIEIFNRNLVQDAVSDYVLARFSSQAFAPASD